ncbi:hypothetical protein GQX74_007374 [Glossina fuscipes]|nr:hypothetical protein GQX74_007374 [Glossina fuscipes]
MSSSTNSLQILNNNNKKRAYRKCSVPFEIMRQHMAASMAKVINNMVNKDFQKQCLEMLSAQHLDEVEPRILFVLEEIDKDLEKEKIEKSKGKKTRQLKRRQASKNICVNGLMRRINRRPTFNYSRV